MREEKTIEVSWGTVFKISLAVLLFYVLFLVKDIFILVLFGIVISVLFEPLIEFLSRFRIPRAVSAVIVYLSFFGMLALMIYGMAPFFVSELQRFSQLFPQYLETLSPVFQGIGFAAFSDVESYLRVLENNAEQIAGNVLAGLFAVLGGIVSAIFVLSMALFLSLEERSVERSISSFFPKKYEAIAFNLWRRSQKRVTGWFVSRVLSSLFVGGATYLALIVFNVQYPFSLSLLAGASNIIQIIGPLVTGFLIAAVVALDSFPRALFVVGAFTLIQQIENNIVSPLLSKRFVGIHPALVLVSLAVGGKLWGIMGAILVVPLVGILFEFGRDFVGRRKKEEVSS